jgi:hypothetical protein
MQNKITYSEKLQDPRWIKKKDEICTRDNFSCRICYTTQKPMHVHHLTYFFDKEPWDYDNDLLKTLCKKHHENEHGCKEVFNNLLLEAMKKGFYYEDFLNIATVILKMFDNKQVYEYFYAKLDKMVSDIEQDFNK